MSKDSKKSCPECPNGPEGGPCERLAGGKVDGIGKIEKMMKASLRLTVVCAHYDHMYCRDSFDNLVDSLATLCLMINELGLNSVITHRMNERLKKLD